MAMTPVWQGTFRKFRRTVDAQMGPSACMMRDSLVLLSSAVLPYSWGWNSLTGGLDHCSTTYGAVNGHDRLDFNLTRHSYSRSPATRRALRPRTPPARTQKDALQLS